MRLFGSKIVHSIPISQLLIAIFAVIPVSMLFGMIAYKADWSITQIFLVSVLGFSGSGQFAALPLSDTGTSLITMVLITTLINSRYFFIALSCSSKLPKYKLPRLLAAHTLGDEVYAIEQGYSEKELLIIRLAIFVSWVMAGVLGGIIAKLFPTLLPDGVNVGFPASLVMLFLAISQLQRASLKSKVITIPKVILGLLISGVFYQLLGNVYFWIPSIILLTFIFYKLRGTHGG